MMIIDKDPATTVPNIREDFISTKLVILALSDGPYPPVVAVAVRDHVVGKFLWYGGNSNGNFMQLWEELRTESLIDLLCKSWYTYIASKRVYIISSYQELHALIAKYNISNSEMILILLNMAYGEFPDYTEAMIHELMGHRAC